MTFCLLLEGVKAPTSCYSEGAKGQWECLWFRFKSLNLWWDETTKDPDSDFCWVTWGNGARSSLTARKTEIGRKKFTSGDLKWTWRAKRQDWQPFHSVRMSVQSSTSPGSEQKERTGQDHPAHHINSWHQLFSGDCIKEPKEEVITCCQWPAGASTSSLTGNISIQRTFKTLEKANVGVSGEFERLGTTSAVHSQLWKAF